MGLFHNDSPEALAHDSVLPLPSILEFAESLNALLPALQVTKHKADLSHELMSGAAAFAAAHEYEKYVVQHGKPENHARAKELL